MSTVYQSTTRTVVESGLRDYPEFGKLLADTLAAMRSGEFPRYIVDAITQPSSGAAWSLYDAYSVAWVHHLIRTGQLAIDIIRVKSVPFNDSKQDENNEILRCFPDPFEAMFVGGRGDDDGFLCWSESVEFQVTIDFETGVMGKETFAANQVPLEVGSTNYGRTKWHILQENGVARWPYHSDRIVIFWGTDRLRQPSALVRDGQRTRVKSFVADLSPELTVFRNGRKPS